MRTGALCVMAAAVVWTTPSRAVQQSHYTPPAASKSVEIGDFYFKKKDYKAALSRYQEASQTDPDYAPAYLGLGRTYEKMGLDQKALAAYRRYLDALPSTKQAEEAKEAHRAIARLEEKLKGHETAPKRRPAKNNP